MTQNKAAINGIFGGGVVTIYFLIFYIINKSLLFNSIFGFLSSAILIGFILYTIQVYFNASGENFKFRTCFGYGFTTGAISIFIAILFQYILYNYIDPELNEMLVEEKMKKLEKVTHLLGEEQVEKVMEQVSKEDLEFSLKSAFIGFGFSLIALIGFFTLVITTIFYMMRKSR